MADVGVGGDRVGTERERLEGRVEVGDAVLSEEADEIEPAEGVFTR